jgi:BirA family biotin operon repressor/biotin-[acetyl-CoA-carboxylase] ligase
MTRTGPYDGETLRRALVVEAGARELVLRGATRSTNDDAWEAAAGGAPSWTVVVADEQSAGRGRHGRAWHSPAGLGLYASLLVRPWHEHRTAGRYTIAAAVAAAEACRANGVAAEIEWPNDVYVGPRKLAGVLGESRSAGPLADAFVVGLGCNVHHREADFPEELRGRATSLALEGARIADRQRLLVEWLRLVRDLFEPLERGDWQTVAARFASIATGSHGRRVRVDGGADGRGSFEGVTCGVDDLGFLCVRADDGALRTVHTGSSVHPGDRPC